jgi:phosphatidylglycerol lysyltransferase
MSDTRTHEGLKRARWLGAAAILAVLAFAIFLLHRELRDFHYRDVTAALFSLRAASVMFAMVLAVVSYAILPAYDGMGLSYAGRSLPPGKLVLSSFISYGLSHTLGFSLATGGSIRYRFWSGWGIKSQEIAKALALIGATFVLGVMFAGGLALLIESSVTAARIGIPVVVTRAIAIASLATCVGYLIAATKHRSVRVFGWELQMPPARIAFLQLAVAAVDWTIAASVLFVLLPSSHGLGLPSFVALFLIAQTAGQISHVPGGAGVFETAMVVFLSPVVPAAEALAALIAYRAIYYLLPFTLAVFSLSAYEIARHRKPIARATTVASAFAARWVPSVIPQALSVTTFIGGVVLLFSGATPGVRGRLAPLDELLPLGVIELSHLAGSIAGAGLLVLAWALGRRLDAAFRLTVWLLIVGIASSLLKGLDWEEAVILFVVLVLLVLSRKAFYRRGALADEPLAPAWIAAVVAISCVTVWLGFFSYKHIEFTTDLWFRFTTYDDAPRFLRASAASLGGLLIFGLMRVLRHAEAEASPPGPEELEKVRSIVSRASSTSANLVLLGDKAVMLGSTGRAFLMYAVEGRSWIAMGDPIGDEADAEELVWRFREEANRAGAWTVFYEIGTRLLPLYIDVGLTLIKIGEEAIIDLTKWSLAGSARKGLRRTVVEVTREGITFEIIERENVPDCLPELRRISDQWLAAKKAREKGFSLGRFDEAYLKNFPIAVLRGKNGIVAFSNLWLGGDGTEMSVDLMRHGDDAPTSAMEYLLITLLEWAKAHGYSRFNLGMAPLAGLQNRAIAPLWSRAGALLFRHGEYFYNFRGLRQYKQKFDPTWEPRYLASPGGLILPRVLGNAASLIAGGLKGVVRK